MRNIKIISQKPTNFQTTWVLICVWNQLLIYFGSQKWTQNFGRFPNRIRSDLGSVFGRFLLAKNKIYKTEIELSFTMAHFWRASRLPLNGAQQPEWVQKSCVFEENNMHFVQFKTLSRDPKCSKSDTTGRILFANRLDGENADLARKDEKSVIFHIFCTKTTFFGFCTGYINFQKLHFSTPRVPKGHAVSKNVAFENPLVVHFITSRCLYAQPSAFGATRPAGVF